MKTLFYHHRDRDIKEPPFKKGIVTLSGVTYSGNLYFTIDSLPRKKLNFRLPIRLDVGEEVIAHFREGFLENDPGIQPVEGIQILKKGKVKFEVTDSPYCSFGI